MSDRGMSLAEEKIRHLRIWEGAVEVEPLDGGMTNENFLVTDRGRRFVVRLGGDIPVHHVTRSNELAASRAAEAAGVSPAVIYHEPGVLVLDHIAGRTLAPEDLGDPLTLPRVISLVRTSHQQIPRHLQGPAQIFWVFHVLRDYARLLQAEDSPFKNRIEDFLTIVTQTEALSGPYDVVFAHNDLLAANFMDDGARLWLIDWEYAGFNTPLFDLSGMAANNGLSDMQQKEMLEIYFDVSLNDELWRRYQAMKMAALLREVMWSMVSELHSALDFDYSNYTQDSLHRFEAAYEGFSRDYI